MDQQAATIWYHDHAIGVTHLNTNMGLAGFFTITDNNEKCLQGTVVAGVCPAPAKTLPSGDYELGFALQDRVFYTDGQPAMPDYPIYNLNSVGCTIDLLTGLANPLTCAQVNFMKAADGHLIPYIAGSPLLALPINVGAPFPAASATLEFFGNMPVVNGVTYGTYNVEPRVYRMRFIGGTDSRTWITELKDRSTGVVIPFWQIGTEQGLLNTPVQRTSMVLMPGERLDVLVDFKGLVPGTQVVMNNLGPDVPYNTLPVAVDPFQARSVDIPEIMQFTVGTLNIAIPDVPTPSAALALRTPIIPLVPTPGVPVRKVSLVEIIDQYGRIMPTIDGRGFMDGTQTEIVGINHTEEWDIINTTVDAHPMHLHQVAFQLINREPIQVLRVDPLLGNILNVTPAGLLPVGPVPLVLPVPNPLTQPNYVGTGVIELPQPFEAGLKDTIMCPPGKVTRIKATFDLLGQYVWHCHILSHEEHDMMRPFKVAPLAAAPATLTVPAVTTGNTVTVVAAPSTDPGMYYVFEFKRSTATAWTALQTGAVPSATIALPAAGTYDFRVKAVDSKPVPTFADSTYTLASSQPITVNTYKITVVQGLNGTITPSGDIFSNVVLAGGSNPVFSIVPSGVNVITSVLVDGVSVGAVASYTFTNVTANHTITATFGTAPGTPVTLVPTANIGTGFTANWSAVAGATSYSLDVSTSSSFATFVTGYGNLNVGNVTSIPVIGLTLGTTYYYRVRVNVAAVSGATSNMIGLVTGAARIGTQYYPTLQDAYNAAVTGAVIQLQSGVQAGTLLANKPVTVTITGGFDSMYATSLGITTNHSKVTLQQGTVRFKNYRVMP